MSILKIGFKYIVYILTLNCGYLLENYFCFERSFLHPACNWRTKQRI